MENKDTLLRVIRLLEPTLCTSCRYAAFATVQMANGSSRRMMHCKRLDCDNWQTEATEEQPIRFYDES